MAESEGGGGGVIETVFNMIFDLLSTVIPLIFTGLWKLLNFVLWVVAAVFILPCVFIAGEIYPLWQKWGEDF